jgi:PAS domain S-box-containing protein
MTTLTTDQLQRENEELARRLEEAEAALFALRSGEADAVFVEAESHRVLTLEAVDKPYRLVVEQMPQAAATLTTDGTIIYCNRRFAEHLRRPGQTLAGKHISEFLSVESRPVFESLLRRASENGIECDLCLQLEDGSRLTLYMGVTALEEGALGTCLLLTDLTEQRHYEELRLTQAALSASEERLREADRKKDEFLATLSHELRNPLAPMLNAVHILKATGLPPAQSKARDMIDRQLNVMIRLLEDLLDVSRISSHKLELRLERVDLAEVLEAALERSRPLIERSGHELIVHLPSEPIHLMADGMRLSQVFVNLLNNAAKYTDAGGTVRLTATREDAHAIVSVRDSGIGIASDMLPRIFEIFTQSPLAVRRSQGGLGIGLSLAKGLVDLHNGTIEAHSVFPGGGSEFIVRLPLDTSAALPEAK